MLFKRKTESEEQELQTTETETTLIDNNPLTHFLESLNDEEKSRDILQLEDRQITQYIRAVTMFQLQAVENFSDCAMKGLILLGLRLHRYNIDELNVKVIFAGTKEHLKEEIFSLTIRENPQTMDSLDIKKMPLHLAYSKDNIHHEKKNSFIHQHLRILALFKTIVSALKDKSGRDSLMATANLLVYFEYLSQHDLLKNELRLDHLILGEESIEKVYDIICERQEIEYTTPQSDFILSRPLVNENYANAGV
jgi:hypothetical protein